MNRSTKLIMPHDLRFRILMFENRQQVKQRKTLCLCSRIRRTAFFIQSTFIADSNTVPVESSHMRSRFRYRPAMVKFPIAGDVKMITYILDTENGASLRAAGWKCAGIAGGKRWTGSRKPATDLYPPQMKYRYEKTV